MSAEEFMWFDAPDVASEDWNSVNSANSIEVSEKEKKKAAEAKAWQQRVRKDEKKAHDMNDLLAGFLLKILRDKKYDFVVEHIVDALSYGVPSNFILWVISIIFPEISDKVREFKWKELVNFEYYSDERISFSDSALPEEVKQRINSYIEDVVDITTHNPSSVITEILLDSLNSDVVKNYFSEIFSVFFNSINVSISKWEISSFVNYVLSEIKANLNDLNVEKI